jgi:hypothetical protein
VDRPRREDARPLGDLEVAPKVARLRNLGLEPLVVLDVDADAARSPKRLNAIVGDHRRSAHSRW